MWFCITRSESDKLNIFVKLSSTYVIIILKKRQIGMLSISFNKYSDFKSQAIYWQSSCYFVNMLAVKCSDILITA